MRELTLEFELDRDCDAAPAVAVLRLFWTGAAMAALSERELEIPVPTPMAFCAMAGATPIATIARAVAMLLTFILSSSGVGGIRLHGDGHVSSGS
jgi:hypothetical protein